MQKDIQLRVSPREASDRALLINAVSRQMEMAGISVNDIRIIRRSIDARGHDVKVNLTVRVAYGDDEEVKGGWVPIDYRHIGENAPTVVIVGAGPAGLFAALRAIELGMRPVVLERGKDVDSRRYDLARISREGTVDPESNYCFGEGGAGAYSDGKLFTRSKKRGNVGEVLGLLYQHGASESVIVDAHPHIGSDKLPGVIRNIRNTIISNGGEVRFSEKVTDLIIDGNRVTGAVTEKGERIDGPVVLATGHSARDVYRMLRARGIRLESKGFAVGVRLEHPQELIDRLQYHSKDGRGTYLPAAEYSFVTQADGRGVYSFCMCPGGVVVPAASGPFESVVNGMSASARGSRWANSGMVVELHPGDFPEYEHEGPFELLAFQEALERKFYDESGSSLNAPAQIMTDFVAGKDSETTLKTSYAPGVHPARLDKLLPPFIAERLRQGFRTFDRQRPGFLTDKAQLIGLESRTSSPVRIPRDRETLRHIETEGLYPAGEGAGYAGGIVSAAIDGRRCVDSIHDNLKPTFTETVK